MYDDFIDWAESRPFTEWMNYSQSSVSFHTMLWFLMRNLQSFLINCLLVASEISRVER